MSVENDPDAPPPLPNHERERRFLVAERSVLTGTTWHLLEQAYVWSMNGYAVRVRRELEPMLDGTYAPVRASLTAKGPRFGDEREEYEMEVGDDYAASIIEQSEMVLRKRRHLLVDDQVWEIDEFLDANDGLIIAELEGSNIRNVKKPHWASREITSDTEYNNDELAKNPVSRWPHKDWVPKSVWD